MDRKPISLIRMEPKEKTVIHQILIMVHELRCKVDFNLSPCPSLVSYFTINQVFTLLSLMF